MLIIKTYSWNRRDFVYDAKCEDTNCGAISRGNSGYDDANYYNNVLPASKCPRCGKSSIDIGTPSQNIAPKHDQYTII